MLTAKELFDAVEKETNITKEITDIFLELDSTGSMATQVDLNNLLLALWERLDDEDIRIEAIGGGMSTSQDDFADWIRNNFDDYSVKLFEGAIGNITDEERASEKKAGFMEKLKNLFDNDPTNSNNIFDRIQDQMTSPSVDQKIKDTVDGIKKATE